MKTYDNDILASHNELKKMPFSVPEGYFDSFSQAMSEKIVQKRTPQWKRAATYIAVAASFALLLTLGATMSGFRQNEDITPEDYILFSDNLVSTSVYEVLASDQMADSGLDYEEIVEYLIYTGVSPETIELSK